MARGLMNALQAALAGVSGGSAGYAKYQQQMKDEQARQAEIERQKVRDALAQSQFNAQYGPEALARQERLTKEQRAWEEQQERDRREFEAKRDEERNRISLATAGQASRVQAQAEQRMLENEAEAWWNQNVRGQQTPEAFRAAESFNAIRSSDRRRPAREIIAGLYTSEMAKRKMLASEFEAGMPTREEMGGAGAGAGSSPSARKGPTQEERARAWMQMNPRMSGESSTDYAARMRAAVGG